jgi:hypothetical protein
LHPLDEAIEIATAARSVRTENRVGQAFLPAFGRDLLGRQECLPHATNKLACGFRVRPKNKGMGMINRP